MAERYVNYDQLLEERRRLGLDEISIIHKVNAFNQFIDHLPTADVAEVKHGEWVPYFNEYQGRVDSYICSLCGRSEERKESYCHCGARMDGKENNVVPI